MLYSTKMGIASNNLNVTLPLRGLALVKLTRYLRLKLNVTPWESSIATLLWGFSGSS